MKKRSNGEGTICKRNDGRWMGQIVIDVGEGTYKRKAVYGKSQKEVKEKMKKLKADSKQGRVIETSDMLLEQWMQIWIDNYKSIYNELGLNESGWLRNHYTSNLFRIGRLQFKIVPSLPEIPSGKYVIETHIPQGEPLNIDACLLAFENAKIFSISIFLKKKQGILCATHGF